MTKLFTPSTTDLSNMIAAAMAKCDADIAHTQDPIAKQAAFLKAYAKGKPIKNFSGNFWGINRNRLTIIKHDAIKAMLERGLARTDGGALYMIEP